MPVADSVVLGDGVQIHHPELVNLYGCSIGPATRIGAFVEIQKNATVGARCKISSHSFICEGVLIEDEVFIGHGVMFINDRLPRATNDTGELQGEADWQVVPTRVRRGAEAILPQADGAYLPRILRVLGQPGVRIVLHLCR